MPKKTNTQQQATQAAKAPEGQKKDRKPKKGLKGKSRTEILKQMNPLFERKPRNFGIGNAVRPKRDLTRFVKWPHYVQLQRQRRILVSRMKVPPTINQFTKTVDKATATQLFKLLNKYRPETEQAKKQRLLQIAQAKAKNESAENIKKPLSVVQGLSHVVRAVEQKKAKLVVIAHDVDPIELVVWLPTLCRKMNVPYCIVKSKSRLGTVVHQKIAPALAFVDVNKDDKNELAQLASVFTETFNNNKESRRQWGGGRLGQKAAHKKQKKERAIARETSSKQKALSQ
jgi:large subunit ribosomal protein L7Ae